MSFRLPILSEHRLAQAIHLTAYNDRHDLLAFVTSSWDVTVFRITGQIAFTIKRKDDECEVCTLKWKSYDSSTRLGVAWNDGSCGIYSGEDGKLLSQFEGEEGKNVVCLGWMNHLVAAKSSETAQILTTEEWHDAQTGGSEQAAMPLVDLRRAITNLDVTKTMPKPSVIAAHGMPYARAGPHGSKFASQTTIDAMFEPAKDLASNRVETFLVCREDQSAQVLQDEAVTVGSCTLPGKPISHAAHAESSKHVILSQADDSGLHMSLIDIPLSKLRTPLLHVVTTNTKRMQNHSDYVRHAVRCIEHDFATGIQLPARLLNSLAGMLEEHEEGELIYNLYNTMMTGYCSPALLEWLVDIVKEQNHKRWDQAVATMYINIQDHIFSNVLPALDRFSVAITTLRGQAKFYEGTTTFDCAPQLLTNILTSVDALRLAAKKMQLEVMTELRQFRAFSRWLRVRIDIGVAGAYTPTGLEIEERESPSMDFQLIRTYIKGVLKKSNLAQHIAPLQSAIESIDQHVHIALTSISTWQTRVLTPISLELHLPGRVTDMIATKDAVTLLTVAEHIVATTEISTLSSHSQTSTPANISGEMIDAKFNPEHNLLIILSLHVPSGKAPESEELRYLLTAHAARSTQTRKSPPSEGKLLHTFAGADAAFKPERIVVGGRAGKGVCVVFGHGGRAWKALDMEAEPRDVENAGPGLGELGVEEMMDEDPF